SPPSALPFRRECARGELVSWAMAASRGACMLLSPVTVAPLPITLLLGLEPQNPSAGTVRENVEVAIRSLAHVANALSQLSQQRFFGHHAVPVELQAHEHAVEPTDE